MATPVATRHDSPQIWDHTPASAVNAGDVIARGKLHGIPANDIDANVLGAIQMQGIFRMPKAASSGVTFAKDANVYWDSGNETCVADPDGGGNQWLGQATLAAADADSIVYVAVNMGHDDMADLHNVITDPGDAGAIPVLTSGNCPLTTAAGETRTLDDPTFAGQRLTLSLDVDGGDCVITAASAVNQTGNNTITMADAGDIFEVVAVDVGGSPKWRVAVNDGAALSTV